MKNSTPSSLTSTFDQEALRQSAAEFLGIAFLSLFPDAYLVGGGTTEFGFFYDFIVGQPVDPQILPMLEEKMRGLSKQEGLKISVLDMMSKNAVDLFQHHDQLVKANEASDARENIIQVLQINDGSKTFYDYNKNFDFTTIKQVLDVKLIEIEKIARYFPNEKDVEVIRIHGMVSSNKADLKQLVKTHIAGKKLDHQNLGERLKLFKLNHSSELEALTWLSKGLSIKDRLIDWWKDAYRQRGFSLISSPLFVAKKGKTRTLEDSLNEVDELDLMFQEKKYTIPSSFTTPHLHLFKSETPNTNKKIIRYAEWGLLFLNKPYDRPLWGLLNTRIANKGQAHTFCRPKDLEQELISFLQFINETAKMFNLGCYWTVRPRGKPLSSSSVEWDHATECLLKAFETCEFNWKNELGEKKSVTKSATLVAEATLIDAIGREWRGPTMTIMVQLPEKLKLCFDEGDRPVILEESLFESIERFIAILIEHYAGKLPTWLLEEHPVARRTPPMG